MKTVQDLERIRLKAHDQMVLREGSFSASVVVAMGDCGIHAGARDVLLAIIDELEKCSKCDVSVTLSDCIGMCDKEPLVEVKRSGEPAYTYAHVNDEKARLIVQSHIVCGNAIENWAIEKRMS